MPVPKDFEDAHKHFISIVQRMADISDTISKGDSDPVKASVALSALTDMYQNYYSTLLLEYQDVVKSKGLDRILKP